MVYNWDFFMQDQQKVNILLKKAIPPIRINQIETPVTIINNAIAASLFVCVMSFSHIEGRGTISKTAPLALVN
jgi:hypothetical protein